MSAAPMPATPFAAAMNASSTGWRVIFCAQAGETAGSRVAIDDSGELFARCEPADPAQIMSGGASAADLEMLAVSLAASPEAQTKAEAWARAGGDVVEARLKTVRVVVTQHRALIVAPADQLAESIDAVVRYCAISRGVGELEKTIAGSLSALEGKGQNAMPAVSQADAANARRSLLRWQRAIEQFHPGLSQNSQRLFGELDEAGRLEERIEMLEDPVQTLYDFCALASERKHYNVGIITEVAILFVLLLELAVMMYQAFHVTG